MYFLYTLNMKCQLLSSEFPSQSFNLFCYNSLASHETFDFTRLLNDAFENLRKTCLKHYNLDPAHYYTSGGFKGPGMYVLNRQVNLLNFSYYEIADMLMMVLSLTTSNFMFCNQNSQGEIKVKRLVLYVRTFPWKSRQNVNSILTINHSSWSSWNDEFLRIFWWL